MKEFIDDYKWLFNEDGKVNKGLECAYIQNDESWFYDPARKIVSLAGYRPYYTDGTPDPYRDEIEGCDWCQIEVAGDVPDCQIKLGELYRIVWNDKTNTMLYDGEEVECLGIVEGDEFTIIKDGDERKIVESSDLEEVHHINELNAEDCKALALKVVRGSIYLSDYRNSFGIPNTEVCNASEYYYAQMQEEHGDDEEDMWHDTAEDFADFMYENC